MNAVEFLKHIHFTWRLPFLIFSSIYLLLCLIIMILFLWISAVPAKLVEFYLDMRRLTEDQVRVKW